MISPATNENQKHGRRGRPARSQATLQDMRRSVVEAGVEALSEHGYVAAGLDGLLRRTSIPKGSFYSLFPSKEAFGLSVLSAYSTYFDRKLDRHLLSDERRPLERLAAFVEDAKAGMTRHDFRRGCVVGNLGQDIQSLPSSFRDALRNVLAGWEDRVAACLRDAQQAGETSRDADPAEQARVFWIGWEGAVLRARLERSTAPLDCFARHFLVAVAASSTKTGVGNVQGNLDREDGRRDRCEAGRSG
ncbi:TetR family transcriptional regulator C-terminal domain-containing protein [Paracoccus tibetensis]|uniref:acrylate utilization transcriptional regulator AcuR n=1 Tax=Paracoccus tibetensis TaxID=336292 RepID=UPI000A4BC41F|nr:TetR family transcriptional regulator C-terminal domain-containing protein [Paracoccus tibetensis]